MLTTPSFAICKCCYLMPPKEHTGRGAPKKASDEATENEEPEEHVPLSQAMPAGPAALCIAT